MRGAAGGKRSKRSDLDDQTLVTLDELRAGGQDGGKTEVVIAGGYAQGHDLPPMPSPGLTGAWKTREVVQSVEIRTSLSEGSEGESGKEEDERRINGSRSTGGGTSAIRPGLRGRQDTISEDGQEGRKATQPYERL